MSTSKRSRQKDIPRAAESSGEVQTRIDPAHVIRGGQTTEPSSTATDLPSERRSPAAETAAMNSEQVRIQAAQLAEHLRRRQREVDHRESRLHAQMARAENDLRSARLLLSERETALEQRESALAEREKAIADRERALAEKDRELEERLEQAIARETALNRSRQQSDGRFDSREKSLRDESERLRRQSEELERRQRRFEEAEAALADARAETERFHQALVRDRKLMESQIAAERERMDSEQCDQLAALEEKRRSLARHSAHVDQCEKSLKQLRGELGQMHRETLELRLATEELWAQLSGSAPPAALTRSLGQVRARLAEQYRLANAELVEQKKELQAIRSQLSEQHEKLVAQKRDLEDWTTRQQEELQCQAERLLAREQQLANQQAELEEQARRWRSRELNYREEIRRLRAELAETDPTLAAA